MRRISGIVLSGDGGCADGLQNAASTPCSGSETCKPLANAVTRSDARRIAISAILLWILPSPSRADPCDLIPERGPMPAEVRSGKVFSGPVVYVGDGDSLCVALGPSQSQWAEVRLADFYAPELHDAGGAEAKATLSRLVEGKRLECVAEHRSYDRVVAVCRLRGRSVGDLMRSSGVREGGRGRK